MADAQLLQEELQHSARIAEGDESPAATDDGTDESISTPSGPVFTGRISGEAGVAHPTARSDQAKTRKASTSEDSEVTDPKTILTEAEDDEDEDAPGEDDDEMIGEVNDRNFHAAEPKPDEQNQRDSSSSALDDDDIVMQGAEYEFAAARDDEDDEEEEEDDEGVGAVKIKPGQSDEEEEDSDQSENSDQASEGDDAWEEPSEAEEEEESESESESDKAGPAAACIFCKTDEPNDSTAKLTCSTCGDSAHEGCATDSRALLRNSHATNNWKCPECADEADDESMDNASIDEAKAGEPAAELGSSPSTGRSSAPKLARDLLPPQKGSTRASDHSMFNHLVLDEDPMDGSRVLRKRKASSAEAEETVMSLRKRHKNSAEQEGADGKTGVGEATRPQSARSLRLKVAAQPPASIIKKSRKELHVKFRVSPTELKQILSHKPRGPPKRVGRPPGRVGRPSSSRSNGVTAALTAPFVSSSYSQPFYSFYDKDTDEMKGKPYGGILSEAEADTSKTHPVTDDRRHFDEAKQKAEEEWKQRLLAMKSEAIEQPLRKAKKNAGPASQIECIEFGGWEIDTWYAAPYPEEYSRNRVLYICEFCLKYMNSDYVAWRHKLKCPAKHPPGDEIYRHGSISVFEVDGRKNPVYCQNLCLLAKLFLGSKTLYYDVEPFLFYVLCEFNDYGYHFVGYFSKEKRASSQNNVSCILTLPIFQRKGYGNLLIDFSYLLTRLEEKTGSPEKPLSDMGLVSYRNYWRLIMCRYLLAHATDEKKKEEGLSIKQISDDTGLTADDAVSALEGLRCLVRDAQTQLYAFRVDLEYCRNYVAKWEAKKYVQLNASALTWTPYVMGRGAATNFELGPAIHAVARREEDDPQKTAAIVADVLANGNGIVHPVTPNGVANHTESSTDLAVLESTESPVGDGKDAQLVTEDARQEVRAASPCLVDGNPASLKKDADSTTTASDGWRAAYKGIPPTRFEVFPLATAGRRGGDRSRAHVGRPALPRMPSTAVRPKPRRSMGSSRRSAAPKPRTSSKRKSGGTGRGPGRWPKGTKKSDYGNAASGPGFPPGWLEAQKQKTTEAAAVAAAKSGQSASAGGDDESEVMDTVEVHTAPDKRNVSSSQTNKAKAQATANAKKSTTSSVGSDDEQQQENEEEEDEEEDQGQEVLNEGKDDREDEEDDDAEGQADEEEEEEEDDAEDDDVEDVGGDAEAENDDMEEDDDDDEEEEEEGEDDEEDEDEGEDEDDE